MAGLFTSHEPLGQASRAGSKLARVHPVSSQELASMRCHLVVVGMLRRTRPASVRGVAMNTIRTSTSHHLACL